MPLKKINQSTIESYVFIDLYVLEFIIFSHLKQAGLIFQLAHNAAVSARSINLAFRERNPNNNNRFLKRAITSEDNRSFAESLQRII